MVLSRLIRCLTLIAAACLLLVPTNTLSSSRGIKVQLRANESMSASLAEEVDLYSSSYALVIGIDKYTEGWPRLSSAVKDAKLVADTLREKGFDVALRTNLNATDLERAFKEFFIVKGDNPQARLFVWFAGHGHTMDGEGYLVPADAPRSSKGAQFKLKALSLRRFGEYVRQARSKHALAVFDSCFSGTIFTTQRSEPPAAVTRATTLPVRQFLSSGDADQSVSDDGMFRKLFIRAIKDEERADANGDGYVTGSELGLFLTDRVTNLTESSQTPRYGKLRDPDYDRGDFVFLTASSGAVNRPPKSMSNASLSAERESLERERQELEQLKLEIERRKLDDRPMQDSAEKLPSHRLKIRLIVERGWTCEAPYYYTVGLDGAIVSRFDIARKVKAVDEVVYDDEVPEGKHNIEIQSGYTAEPYGADEAIVIVNDRILTVYAKQRNNWGDVCKESILMQ